MHNPNEKQEQMDPGSKIHAEKDIDSVDLLLAFLEPRDIDRITEILENSLNKHLTNEDKLNFWLKLTDNDKEINTDFESLVLEDDTLDRLARALELSQQQRLIFSVYTGRYTYFVHCHRRCKREDIYSFQAFNSTLGIEALHIAISLEYFDIADYLPQYPSIEKAIVKSPFPAEVRNYLLGYYKRTVESILNRKAEAEKVFPNISFDFQNRQETIASFYLIKSLITLRHPPFIPYIRELLSIPSLRKIAHIELTPGIPNELLQWALALDFEGAEVAALLYSLPEVAAEAARQAHYVYNNYYIRINRQELEAADEEEKEDKDENDSTDISLLKNTKPPSHAMLHQLASVRPIRPEKNVTANDFLAHPIALKPQGLPAQAKPLFPRPRFFQLGGEESKPSEIDKARPIVSRQELNSRYDRYCSIS